MPIQGKALESIDDDWVIVNNTSQDFNVAASGINAPSAKNEQHIVNRNMWTSRGGEKPHHNESKRGGGIYCTERRGRHKSRHTVHGAKLVQGKLLNGDADFDSFCEFFGLRKMHK